MFFNPVVFVKGKLILGFCNLAAIWLETQAAQERARESARIYMQICSYFPTYYILRYIACICLCRPGIGWARGHRTKSKRLSSCGFQKHGVSSYTPSETHCPFVRVFVCIFGRFCSRRLFSYFTLGLLTSKTAVLEIKYSNKYCKRAVDTPILAHCPLGK
mgnify:CR=1 FL=1